MRLAWLALAGLALVQPGSSAEEPPCHESGETPAVEHVGRYSRTYASYAVPEVTLLNQNSEEIRLPELLGTSRPLAVNFVFTTCTTICPVMTATFAQMQRELGDAAGDLQLVSISIDPEYDTPPILREYAKRYGAQYDWQFLTGDAQRITRVLDAFDALTGSKMNHEPFTLFHIPGEKHWVRIDGLTSGSDLASEYRRLLTQ
jgi:protein SCO1/2